MGVFTPWKTSVQHLRSKLTGLRMAALCVLSVGVLTVLIGMHPPVIHVPLALAEQGPGRGAGGSAATPQGPSLPAFCLPPDTGCILNSVASQVAVGIQGVLQPLSDQILKNPADIVYQTPLLTNDTDAQNRAILSLNTFFIAVVDLAFACLVLIAGYNVMVGRHLLMSSSTLMEILPRGVLIVAAVHFNVFFASLFIAFENALTLDVIHIAGLTMLTNLIAGLFTFQNVGLLSFILILILGVMMIMLLIQMITRLALVAVSLALAPLGLGCFFLPQTMRWGRLWLVTLSSSVMVQFVQVVALGLGGVFVTAIAATSLVRLDQNLAMAFLAIGTLGIVLKIPGMLQTWALHPMMDTSGSGGGSGSNASTTTNSSTSSMFGNGGGGSTTVTEASAGGMMEGSMVAGESGALLLMF